MIATNHGTGRRNSALLKFQNAGAVARLGLIELGAFGVLALDVLHQRIQTVAAKQANNATAKAASGHARSEDTRRVATQLHKLIQLRLADL